MVQSPSLEAKGAFTGVPQVDLHGWINQSEPCKQFLSTEVINAVDGWTSWRWPTFVQRRRFTLGDSPQITRINRRWLTADYPYQQAVTHRRLPVSTSESRTVPQCRTSRTSFFPSYFFFLKCVDILSLNSHISQQQLPAQVHLPPFWNFPHKFVCRHFEIDCLVHLCGTVWIVSFNRWIQFRWFNRVDQPGGAV